MKSNLRKSALAVSAMILATAAHAQSSVTLYGIVDAGVMYMSKTRNATGGNGGKFIGFTDSGEAPSVFGLKGDEDLGGGMHAEFNLESGINLGNGGFNNSNGNLFGRQAWVGVRGNLGTLRAGLQYSPFFDVVWEADPRGLSQLGSNLVVYSYNALGTGVFNSNMIKYDSPVIAGLQGSVMLALGGVAGDFQAGRQYSANLQYHWRDLGVFAAYYNGNTGGAMTPLPTNLGMQARIIGASYKFDALTAKASFTNYKMAGSGINNNVYNVGVDFMATPVIDLNAGVWYMVNRDDTSSKSLLGAVGANYFLSRRTGIYTQVGVVNNKGGQNLGLAMGEAPTTLYAPAGTTVGVNVGIRHLF